MVRGFKHYDLTPDFFDGFDDLDKLKCLNDVIRNRSRPARQIRYHTTREEYISIVCRFYYCQRFNKIYKAWIESGKKQHLKPSIDHWTPLDLGGDNSLSNLKVLTIMQNRAKGNMTPEEWLDVIKNSEEHFY